MATSALSQAPPPPGPLLARGRGGAIHTSERAEAAAKRMRRAPTHAEAQLWKSLRRLKRTDGQHFRRQVPFGPYVADFACHELRLVIELDGGVHDLPGRAEADARRDAFLASRGYRVLRFSNEFALVHPARILASIGSA